MSPASSSSASTDTAVLVIGLGDLGAELLAQPLGVTAREEPTGPSRSPPALTLLHVHRTGTSAPARLARAGVPAIRHITLDMVDEALAHWALQDQASDHLAQLDSIIAELTDGGGHLTIHVA